MRSQSWLKAFKSRFIGPTTEPTRRRTMLQAMQLEDRITPSLGLIADINSGPSQESSDPRSYIDVDGITLFIATTPTTGTELWRTDGTELGTKLVKDINPGSTDAFYSYGETRLVVANGLVYFVADDGSHGTELWKSDGTEAGTTLVKDIYDGASSAFYSGDNNGLISVNGIVYFVAQSFSFTSGGRELWKSDGTDAGTTLVKDIYPGYGSGFGYSSNVRLTNVNGTLYFAADDGTHGFELWKSDGTEAGTVLVKDIQPGINSAFDINYPTSMLNVDGKVYLTANDGIHGYEIWTSDGTASGTTLLKDVQPGALDGVNLTAANALLDFSSTVYFLADDGTHGIELWKTDGTENGTTILKDLYAGSKSAFESLYSLSIESSGNTLYFAADDGTHGIELWKSDGTQAGTVLVKDILPGSASSIGYGGQGSFASLNGKVYFAAYTYDNGLELWESNGTPTGTKLVKDIYPSYQGGVSYYSKITNVNGKLYFSANDGIHGTEVWTSDGTATGTRLAGDLISGTGNSLSIAEESITTLNGILYFIADDGVHGYELWKSNGTQAGTQIVKDILPGLGSALSSYSQTRLTVFNGAIYFAAYDYEHGSELWKSDGTAAGTVPGQGHCPRFRERIVLLRCDICGYRRHPLFRCCRRNARL